jgi:hypothetical protein
MQREKGRGHLQDVGVHLAGIRTNCRSPGEDKALGTVVPGPILVSGDVHSAQTRRFDGVDRRLGVPQDRQIGQVIDARPGKELVDPENFLHGRPPGLHVHDRA